MLLTMASQCTLHMPKPKDVTLLDKTGILSFPFSRKVIIKCCVRKVPFLPGTGN